MLFIIQKMFKNLSFFLIGLFFQAALSAAEIKDEFLDKNVLAWKSILQSHKNFDAEKYKYYVSIFEDSASVVNVILIDKNDVMTSYRYVYDHAVQGDFMARKKAIKLRSALDDAIMAPLGDSIEKFIPQALVSYPNGDTSITRWVNVARIINCYRLEDE